MPLNKEKNNQIKSIVACILLNEPYTSVISIHIIISRSINCFVYTNDHQAPFKRLYHCLPVDDQPLPEQSQPAVPTSKEARHMDGITVNSIDICIYLHYVKLGNNHLKLTSLYVRRHHSTTHHPLSSSLSSSSLSSSSSCFNHS